ncbi:hypothetical protein [Litorilituus sediminis]|uniref:Uncharacterized protein n=1 Tax=Litorilituus sediminis TaxID=718192 RepID=A0A4P6P166_9GAMM|nr:hypothetical protein [Litorilituus sediminis]QBG34976.1 hypothetical protein EMK97_04105 [Litorilituus sediminis]
MRYFSALSAVAAGALLSSLPAQSADISTLKTEANILTDKLTSVYQQQTKLDSFAINEIEHYYLAGQGIAFKVDTNVDLLPVIALSKGITNEEEVIDDELARSSKAMVKKEQEALNALRIEQRNLAHHEFSLHKKIESLQKRSANEENEESKQKFDSKIRQTQDELRQIITQKQQVSAQIENKEMSVTMSQSADTSASNTDFSRQDIYQVMLLQTFQQLCRSQALINELPEGENITVIFKGLGALNGDNYMDQIVVSSKDNLNDCLSTPSKLAASMQNSKKYQY